MTRQEPPFDTNALAAAVKTVAHDLRADAMKARRERDAMVREVTQIFAQQEQSRTAFTERYGFARPAMAARMGDKWMVGIGGSIYKQTQEGPYNFMNALHDHALDFFGIPFLEQEETKPFAERHPAIPWMHTVVDLSQKLREYGSDDPRAEHIGSGAAWGRFAYDLYTIADNAKLHASMRRRLINNRDFQGARHELRVAALCVVAGFELAFEDESDNSRTHPEFIASDRFSNVQVAVEAKSRHRRGVHGFQGGKSAEPGETVDVRGIVVDAYQKQTDLPLYVFVDVNLPSSDERTWSRWMEELETTMMDLAHEGYTNPCPANAVFFSNDPSHYVGEGQIGNPADRLWIRNFVAELPRTPHPEGDIVSRFMTAHRQRLAPPGDFPEFQSGVSRGT